MAEIPDFITHYHLPDREPFLNLSDLDDDQLVDVLADLDSGAGTSRRFGPSYVALRRASEELLRARFIRRGGRPERAVPHYFVLGESEWFEGLYDDPRQVRFPLDELPADQISFTIPDSLTAMGLLPDFGIHLEPRGHHGKVFLIRELGEVAAHHGLPSSARPDDYTGHQFEDFEHYTEVQVWTDRIRR
ncbi:hypothetical protein ASG90_14970 [Nocardioides sp. Soil797]|nr:hypothetical protein ASG90_14970 [Nocardioides sp. Soil797]